MATGKVIGECHRRHRHQEFLKAPRRIDQAVPHEDGVTIHLVMDNHATHKTPAVKKRLLRHLRFEVHFTPGYPRPRVGSAAWLNQVERFFAEITQEAIRRGVSRSVKALKGTVNKYPAEYNK